MKKNWWLIIILVVALIVTFPYVFKKTKPQVIINDKTFNIELAKTSAELTKGLSNRDYLAPDAGMLFIFSKTDIWPFWMKDTRIPLDIIWIQNNKIVDITTLQPQNGDNIPEYSPKEKANYVLEINADSGFKVGDKVKIKY